MADFFILPISDPMMAASHLLLPAHPVPEGACTARPPSSCWSGGLLYPAVVLRSELDWTGRSGCEGQEL